MANRAVRTKREIKIQTVALPEYFISCPALRKCARGGWLSNPTAFCKWVTRRATSARIGGDAELGRSLLPVVRRPAAQ